MPPELTAAVETRGQFHRMKLWSIASSRSIFPLISWVISGVSFASFANRMAVPYAVNALLRLRSPSALSEVVLALSQNTAAKSSSAMMNPNLTSLYSRFNVIGSRLFFTHTTMRREERGYYTLVAVKLRLALAPMPPRERKPSLPKGSSTSDTAREFLARLILGLWLGGHGCVFLRGLDRRAFSEFFLLPSFCLCPLLFLPLHFLLAFLKGDAQKSPRKSNYILPFIESRRPTSAVRAAYGRTPDSPRAKIRCDRDRHWDVRRRYCCAGGARPWAALR